MSIYNLLLGLASSFVFNATIASNVSNYNLYTQAAAAGWNGIIPLKATITINSGVQQMLASVTKAGIRL